MVFPVIDPPAVSTKVTVRSKVELEQIAMTGVVTFPAYVPDEFAEKFAVTFAFVFKVIVQLPVPVHAPDHPLKMAPEAGFALREIWVPVL